MEKTKGKVAAFFGAIGRFFCDFKEAVVKGDLFVKLSLIWMGVGYFRRKQYVKSIIITIFEALVIAFSVVCSFPYVAKFGTLGTVKRAAVFNPTTMRNEVNDFDNSFMILLFSVVSFVVWAIFLAVWMSNVKKAYELQKMADSYQMEVDKLKEFMGENEKKQMKEDIAVQEAVTLIADAAVEG